MNNYKEYIRNFIEEKIYMYSDDEGIVIQINKNYTCISKGLRYAVGKGKEGRFYNYYDHFLRNKNIVAYYIIKDKRKDLELIRDDPQKINFIPVPTIEEYNAMIEAEKENRKKMLINMNIDDWKKRLKKYNKNDVIGYYKEPATVGDRIEIVLILNCNNERAKLYITTYYEEEVAPIENIIKNYFFN